MITDELLFVNKGGNVMKKLRAAVIGFGARGIAYSQYALKHTDELEIVAVQNQLRQGVKTQWICLT